MEVAFSDSIHGYVKLYFGGLPSRVFVLFVIPLRHKNNDNSSQQPTTTTSTTTLATAATTTTATMITTAADEQQRPQLQ